METKKKEEKIGFRDVKRILGWYWKLTKKHSKWFWLLLFSYGAGSLVADVLSVVVYKKIIDALTAGSFEQPLLWQYFYLLVLMSVFYFILFRFGELCLRKYHVAALKDLSNFTFTELEKHSYNFFANHFTGSLTSQSRRFVDGFVNISEGIVFVYWMNLISVIGILFVITVFSWPLALFLFLFTILIVIAVIPLLKKRMKYDAEEAEATSKLTGYFSDVITNVLNVKMFASSTYERRKFREITEVQAQVEDKSFKAWNLLAAIQNGLIVLMRIILLGISLYLWSQGKITAGTIVLAYSYSQSIFMIAWSFVRSTSGMLKSVANAKEMVDIFELETEIKDQENPQDLVVTERKVTFMNVDFSYPEGEKVFQGLSFTVAPGEHVGLVGPSGGGKSTVTKLLLRFVEPTSGTISIDGQDITKVRQDDLRTAIAYVPQDPALFHRSLRENISYAKPEATEAEIIEAAKKSHAHEFISKLKEGYDTPVGERGVKLSGGQRQRIAIARAILKNAPILVMDEATSALDTISEVAIREAISELIENKTAIIIAHRLSTVEKMDRIIVLGKDGTIEEEGSHRDLINRGGLYSTLWNHQTGGFLPVDEDNEGETEESIGA